MKENNQHLSLEYLHLYQKIALFVFSFLFWKESGS
jgi:hypothetical protein